MRNPYSPDRLPLAVIDADRLIKLVGEANAELARYDGLLHGIPEPALMLSPLTIQEAVLSSKIEGTQVSINDIYEHEAGAEKDSEQQKDIQEVVNYRIALNQARDYLSQRPITLSYIRDLHKILMSSVRGQGKSPWEFRDNQNWIGAPGCKMEEASFIPPPPDTLQESMQKWQRYLESEAEDALLQTAVVHAQFELIHPFRDGNGRIGRILIPLFLYQRKKIFAPMFYLSEYLEANREEYYARLTAISRQKDWNGWIEFFLKAICAQASKNSKTVEDIMSLYGQSRQKILGVTHSKYAIRLLDAIFRTPIFKMSEIVETLSKTHKVNRTTVSNLIGQFKDAGILKELHPGKGRKSAIIAFPALINLVEGQDIL